MSSWSTKKDFTKPFNVGFDIEKDVYDDLLVPLEPLVDTENPNLEGSTVGKGVGADFVLEEVADDEEEEDGH